MKLVTVLDRAGLLLVLNHKSIGVGLIISLTVPVALTGDSCFAIHSISFLAQRYCFPLFFRVVGSQGLCTVMASCCIRDVGPAYWGEKVSGNLI